MLVREIMTARPVLASITWTVSDVINTLEELPIRHLPVVDTDGELVGIVSDRDLRRVSERPDGTAQAAPAARSIAELMSGGVVSVAPDDDVDDVIEALLENQIGAVPVVDTEGGVVGIVSYVDVLRHAQGRL